MHHGQWQTERDSASALEIFSAEYRKQIIDLRTYAIRLTLIGIQQNSCVDGSMTDSRRCDRHISEASQTMAENLAGLVISGVGLVALVSTVAACFESIEIGRGFGRQYDHHALQLDLAKLALQRWCRSVDISDAGPDANLMDRLALASEHETELVRKLLENIQLAFEDAEKTAKRYTPPTPANQASDSQDIELAVLDDRVRKAFWKRQGGVSVTNKVRWVLHDAKASQILVDRVSQNVKSLVDMFQGAAQVTQEEFRAIVDPCDVQTLALLRVTAENVDSATEQRATEALIGCAPVWENNSATGDSKVSYGDMMGSDFTGKVAGLGYCYRGNRASGSAQVTYGTRYGSQYREPFSD